MFRSWSHWGRNGRFSAGGWSGGYRVRGDQDWSRGYVFQTGRQDFNTET